MEKGLPVSKYALKNRPEMPHNLSAQAQNFRIFDERRLHRASVVRDTGYMQL